MSTNKNLPAVKVVKRAGTYFGVKANLTITHHDKNRNGLRTVRTEWLGKADERNGGYPAGTITERTIREGGDQPIEVVTPTHIVEA